MNHIVFSIDDSSGQVTFLLNDLSRPFVDESSTIRRASNVEPINAILRIVFYTLRFLFGEYSRMGQFTRVWPCTWRVNLSPVSGPILPIVYRNRQEAINAEIEWLELNFL
jgi:hypothetical protein